MESEKPRLNWLRLIIVTVLLMGIGFGAFIFNASREVQLVADPTVVKANSNYDDWLNPIGKSPDMDLAGLKEAMEITETEEDYKIRVQGTGTIWRDWGYQHMEVLRVPWNEKVRVGDGDVWVEYIGVSHGKLDPSKSKWDQETDKYLFDREMKPITIKEVKKALKLKWLSEIENYQGMFPEVTVGLSKDKQARVRLLGMDCYDGRTRRDITHGLSYHHFSDKNHHAQTSFEMRRWHDGPLMVSYDLGYGEAQEFRFKAEAGVNVKLPHGEIEVVGVFPRGNRGLSTSSGSSETTITLRKSKDGEDATIGLLLLPETHLRPFDIEVFDKEGEQLRNGGMGSSGPLLYKHVAKGRGKVHEIKLTYFPKMLRVIFEFPSTPGLPEVNHGVTNLFEIQAPHIVIEREHQMRDFVSATTGLGMSQAPGKIPAAMFPYYVTNATPASVLEEMLLYAPTEKRAVVNHQAGRIEFRDPWHVEMKNELQKKLKKIFK